MRYVICSLLVAALCGAGFQALSQDSPLGWMERHEGMRESGGPNRGPVIDRANRLCQVPLGSPWCAAIISLAYSECGFSQPKTAWSPAMFPEAKRVSEQSAKAGDLAGIYFPSLGRIGHVLMIRKRFGSMWLTVEGNTNSGGSRDGDGLYFRKRPVSQIRFYSRW